MPKYHLDNCCVKGRPRNWGLEIWSSQVGWGEYVCVCVWGVLAGFNELDFLEKKFTQILANIITPVEQLPTQNQFNKSKRRES